MSETTIGLLLLIGALLMMPTAFYISGLIEMRAEQKRLEKDHIEYKLKLANMGCPSCHNTGAKHDFETVEEDLYRVSLDTHDWSAGGESGTIYYRVTENYIMEVRIAKCTVCGYEIERSEPYESKTGRQSEKIRGPWELKRPWDP